MCKQWKSHRLSGHKSPVARRQVETDANLCLSSLSNSQRPIDRRKDRSDRRGLTCAADERSTPKGVAARAELGPCQPDEMFARTAGTLEPVGTRAVGRGSPTVGCANPSLDAQSDRSNAGTRRFGRRSRHQADPCRSRATASAVGSQRHPPRRMRPIYRCAAIRK